MDYPQLDNWDNLSYYIDSIDYLEKQYYKRLNVCDYLMNQTEKKEDVIDISVNVKPETFIYDITMYNDILSKFKYLNDMYRWSNSKLVNIVVDILSLIYLYEKKEINGMTIKETLNDIFANKNNWISRRNIQDCPASYLHFKLDQFIKTQNHHSIHCIKQLIEDIFDYYVYDDSVIKHYLVNDLKSINKSMGFINDRIVDTYEQICWSIEIIEYMKKNKISKGVGIEKLIKKFPEYAFNKIFIDKLSVTFLESMYKVVEESEDLQQFFKTSNKISLDNPLVTQLYNHHLIKDCGHSEMTFNWTLNKISYIYKYGWIEFVELVLINRKLL